MQRQHPDQRRRQFDCQRQPFQADADGGDDDGIRGGQLEIRAGGPGAQQEQLDRVDLRQAAQVVQRPRVGHGQGRHRVLVFARNAQRNPAGDQALDPRAVG